MIDQPALGYWRVVFSNPPLNLFNQKTMEELETLTARLEADPETRVVVFESADPDFFMAHLDVTDRFDQTPRASGLPPWPDVTLRLAQAPFVSIAKVRGRARGVGSELAQAFDMRFASRENAIFCQIEVPTGLMPGGGGLERLPLLIGRARAIEAIIGGADFSADLAERYGWINRALPDADLDGFVDALARRIASYDRPAIASAKSVINAYGGIPRAEDLQATQTKFFDMLSWPTAQTRIAGLFAQGFSTRGDLEMNLGARLGAQ
jgi:enoyl-CoA hydratase/carnithine racemase